MKRRYAVLSAVLALAACDIPSGAPNWDMTWSVPSQTTTIAVNTFLPSGVTVGGPNNAFFVVTVASVAVTRQLGQDCAACIPANGLNVPKPAFTGHGVNTTNLSSGSIGSATLVNDTLTLTIANGFNFDPLRPAVAANSARGWIRTVVTNGSTVLGRDSANGSTVALTASGGTLIRKIPLSGSVASASPITLTVDVDSPAGDNITVNTNQTISFTASAGTFFISSATVNLATNQSATAAPTALDLHDIPEGITDRINNGTIFFTVTNPFAVTGTFNATFTGGTQTVVKTFTLASGNSTPTLTMTKAELQAILGHNVNLTLSGAINGTNVTFTPGQTVTVGARIQLNLNVKS